MLVRAIRTRVFKEGEDLAVFVAGNIKTPKEGSVVVVTSKIVALSEKRVMTLANAAEKARVIRAESDFAIKTKFAWLTIKDGIVMANAGVDESNAKGRLILLPKDSFKAVAELRKKLAKLWKLKKLGVLITDSRLLPLRAGVVGVALGYAGFKGIKDYRGTKDIFGRKLKMTRVDVADSLATAAVLEMGEGREQQPLAVIEDAPVEFTEKINKKELVIDIHEDLYGPLFRNTKK
ncbi:coenzyme F420-0:L-glutamate ligase [Candidatus Kaiserbacteria bacterium]|nr:coenzyme F420-0:L-glutamate ligase [Candidatus Kaiserbacteria bacterium]